MSATYSSKGISWRGLAFDRDRLDASSRLPDVKLLLDGVHPAHDPLASKASAHILVFTVDRQLPIRPDRASKGLLIDLHQPSIRIDCLGNSKQRRECRAGHTRWLVATGARLVGPLAVVVRKIRLGERRRPPRASLADAPASTPDQVSGEISRRMHSNRAGAGG
jgi:hypothetical protein